MRCPMTRAYCFLLSPHHTALTTEQEHNVATNPVEHSNRKRCGACHQSCTPHIQNVLMR